MDERRPEKRSTHDVHRDIATQMIEWSDSYSRSPTPEDNIAIAQVHALLAIGAALDELGRTVWDVGRDLGA